MHKYFYLVKIQFLGYRFHGWQKQPKLKTIHRMVDRTLKYVLGENTFKSLGAGRTDAMVSAESAAFELFLQEPITDIEAFLKDFNINLPQDIRALSVEEVAQDFNIIQNSKQKEYHYLFAYGDKFHPFCAPIMTTFLDDLDIKSMQKGARLFEGRHNFKAYCYKSSEKNKTFRTIEKSELIENSVYTANFFPEKSYLLKLKSSGFGRNQIRLMMGTLVELGRGDRDLNSIRESLEEGYETSMVYIAPASGLILHSIDFNQKSD
ncbi:tRNA pseudouridine38-40 synthase [Flavobacteriaceae bacterium MAR_2010_188]|nr:tRNA pseudouridine38-40 synthase [Flavobacteriaceae bacterium MAR_2010_188]